MSGTSVANKVNKAFTKVSSKLGFQSKILRPDGYTNPTQEKNLVKELMVSWSVDENFVKNPVDELDHYKVYISNNEIQLGDIIVCEEQATTLIITEIQPIRTPAGILANERMTISRSMATPLLDKKTTLVEVALDVPCAVKIGKAAQGSVQHTTMKTGTSVLEIWTWMPAQDVLLADVIDVLGTRYLVNSVNSSTKGTKITATSMSTGK